MRIVRFDSVGGASGDMILASLIDAGADISVLNEKLQCLNLGPCRIEAVPCASHGLHGTRVNVIIPDAKQTQHRHLTDIKNLITNSALPENIKTMSLNVFERLAGAEAFVHGISPDEVHFHEVGAEDAIVDIVGACIALDILEISDVNIGPLPLGNGTVVCEHGTLPVPAPATIELLKGFTVVQTDEPFEMVTPTGAAILTAWTQSHGKENTEKKCIVTKVGHGFGQRQMNNRPNLLRATLLEHGTVPDSNHDECLVLECNIDDSIPELLGSLAQKLNEQGALDVFMTSIQMKKQRSGILLTVLCKPSDRERMLDLIFTESTTFGVREYITRRTVLDRRHIETKTPYGTVRIKIGSWRGKDITHAPEHDDCVTCADKQGVPVRAVYEAALKSFNARCIIHEVS